MAKAGRHPPRSSRRRLARAKESESPIPPGLLGGNIKAARLAAGMTQEELAHRAGMQTAVYSRIERGDVDASMSSMAKIAHGLGMRLAELVEGVDGV